jgi:hypothetical protein
LGRARKQGKKKEGGKRQKEKIYVGKNIKQKARNKCRRHEGRRKDSRPAIVSFTHCKFSKSY